MRAFILLAALSLAACGGDLVGNDIGGVVPNGLLTASTFSEMEAHCNMFKKHASITMVRTAPNGGGIVFACT